MDDEPSRRFVGQILPNELPASVASVTARLRGLLALDRVRAVLSARQSLTPSNLIDADVTLIDAATAPMGEESLAAAFGSWVFYLTANATMTRRSSAPLLIVVDEFQRLGASAAAMTRLLEQSRAAGAGLHLCTQTTRNIDSALRDSIVANTNLVAMTPREEVGAVEAYLRPSGRMVDAEQPDRLLTRTQEKDRLIESLRQLGKREGVFVERAEGRVTAFRAAEFPYAELAHRASRVPVEDKTRIARGSHGVLAADLLAASSEPIGDGLGQEIGNGDDVPDARPAARRSRPIRLVMP
jgi:hypothetical protein